MLEYTSVWPVERILDSTAACTAMTSGLRGAIEPMCDPKPGSEFEMKVEGLLNALGYAVICDIHVCGAQIDLIAQRKTDPLGDLYAVECKDHKSSVGTKYLAEFQSKLVSIRSAYPQARGCIVARSEFTAGAKERAKAAGIALVSEYQLEDSVLGCSAWLTQYICRYERSDMFHLFVDPLCHWRSQGSARNPGRSARLVDSLLKWSLTSGPGGLVMFGDYGTGKTVACQHLAYLLAKERISGGNRCAPIPLIFYLKDYYRTLDLRSMITDRLVNELGINIPYDTFVQFVQEGHFCLILDGFDEMAMRVDAEIRNRNFVRLKALSGGRSKVIIAGRLGYFPTDQDIEKALESDLPRDMLPPDQLLSRLKVPDFEALDIQLFEDKEIAEYLQRYYALAELKGECVDRIAWKDLRKVYNLLSLSKRPVLLNLILGYGPDILRKGEKRLTAGELYREYTSEWLDREVSKGKIRRLLLPEAKKRFVRELAWDMFSRRVFTVNYQDGLPSAIIEHFGSVPAKEFDYLDNDIRTCSYMIRDKYGNYSFAHKSFMEYFVAEKIDSELRHGNVEVLSLRAIPPEIMGFFVDIRSPEASETISSWALVPQAGEFGDNALRYFSRVPVAEAVEYLLVSMVTQKDSAGRYRRVLRRAILSARGARAQEACLALWNILYYHPYRKVREAARGNLDEMKWGGMDPAGILSKLIVNISPDAVAEDESVSSEVVSVLKKDWDSVRKVFDSTDDMIQVLKDFDAVHLSRDDVNHICRETAASPELARSLAYAFGREGLEGIVGLLKTLRLSSDLRWGADNEISDALINELSTVTGLDTRAVRELRRKSRLDSSRFRSVLMSKLKDKRRSAVHQVSQALGEPTWAVGRRLQLFASAAKRAGLLGIAK